MAILFGNNILAGASGAGVADTGADVGTYTGKSLMFNPADSPFLSRTPAGAGNRRTWTISVWVKRVQTGAGHRIICHGTTAGTNEFTELYFGSDDKLSYYMYTGGATIARGFTNRLFRDTSAFYHIVWAVDTTQSVAADRTKLYVNGEQITSFSDQTDFPLNTDTHMNNTGQARVGSYMGSGTGNHFDGYMSQIILIDGLQLDPSAFAHESPETGAWVMEEPPVAECVASGGNAVTQDGQHKVHKFTANGTLTVTQGGLVEYLVIGGGGGGGKGGGGAGGFRTGFLQVPAGTYSVTVGGGGAGSSASSGDSAGDGVASVFSTITSAGGGHGGGDSSSNGGSGGSGGGGGGSSGTAGAGNTPSTSPVQGFAGGAQGGARQNGAGGGGASAVGTASAGSGHPNVPGNGGAGLASDIIVRGSDVDYAGGGGGGGDTGAGGGTATHGGGRGEQGGSGGQQSGTANTGGGGGGINGISTPAGSGGSGIVVVRYFNPDSFSFGTNGFYFDFSDADSTTVTDNSANSNAYTATNYSSDVDASYVTDTPVNNFCILNALSNHEIVLSDGNLKGTGTGSNWDGVASTFAVTSGKWYWEVKALNVSEAEAWTAGIHQTGHQNNGLNWYNGSYVGQAYGVQDNNKKATTGTQSAFTSDIATGDIVQFRLNLDDNELSVSVDGVDKGKLYDITDGIYYSPAVNLYGTSSVIMNFGQDSSFLGTETATSNADGNGNGTFNGTVPTDYLALCSDNLPDVEIGQEADDLATDYFNSTIYTGNGSNTHNIALGLEPDLVLIKERSNVSSWAWVDSVRGAGTGDSLRVLDSTSDNAEFTAENDQVRAFTSTGMTLDDNTDNSFYVNRNTQTYVAHSWLAGTAFSNDESATGVGSIDSEGEINEDAGFAIIKYVGNGADSTDIGIAHGLSQTPEFITIKNRSRGSMRWVTWHTDLSADGSYTVKNLLLNTTTAEDAFSSQFKSASSTLFTVRDDDSDGNAFVNRSGDNYIAYLWHSVEGYSHFGKFVGNGSADGTFVYTGFEPAYVCIKCISNANSWTTYDNARNPTNPDGRYLLLEDNGAEVASTTVEIDKLSNGFKARDNQNNINGSGREYIYMAFSSGTGFKYGNAS